MSFEVVNGVFTISENAVFSTAMACVLLLLGYRVKRKVPFLEKYCIPAPVIGGFLFMFVTFIGHNTGTFAFKFDSAFQSPFMLAFFTTVGLGASFELLKKGGLLLILYWLCAGVISIVQNVIGITVGDAVGLPAPYALLSSAISMIGGHGAAGAYGRTFEELGYAGAMGVGAAAATFGLISGVMVGGPLARRLIVRYDLKPQENNENYADIESINAAESVRLTGFETIQNVAAIIICMALGMVVSGWIGKLLGMSFPDYVGAMFVAVALRNLNEKFQFYKFSFSLSDKIGDVMLNLYLGLALMTLRLWELMDLMGGMLLIVVAQLVFMCVIAYFVVFRILGSNYDAAVMCAGLCGHGLGATPSAIVNMTAVTEQYGMSRKAFMIVPIVGAFLVDIIYQPQTIYFIKKFVEGITK